jgi:hypothetical protein
MPLNEIEIAGSSISLKCWSAEIPNITETFQKIMQEGDQFSIDPEFPGFHDCDTDGEIIRGFYSGIIPFEIEHLVEGITTKTLFRRIESCEFIATKNMIFTTGKPGPMKGLAHSISGLSGYHVAQLEFEFNQLSQLQDRMTRIKSIVVTNPKDKEVRRARLAGQIESYTDYNIIDPRNHGIDSVSGIMDTPLGPLTATIGRKGSIRLGVKKGFIVTVDCLEWIISLIKEEKAPEPVNAPQSAF